MLGPVSGDQIGRELLDAKVLSRLSERHVILYPTSGAESVAAGTRQGTVLVYVNPQYVLPVSPDVSATGPHPLVPADSHAHSLLLGPRFA
jgi:hypothetical protein